MKMESVALYARVSSNQQARESTIDSQIEAIRKKIVADGGQLIERRTPDSPRTAVGGHVRRVEPVPCVNDLMRLRFLALLATVTASKGQV